MHPKSLNRPSQMQLVFPLLQELAQHPEGARPVEVAAALADRFNISPEARAETIRTADGKLTGLWRRHVRFARQKAVELGYLRDDTPGLWMLTDEGAEGIGHVEQGMVVVVVTGDLGQPIGAQIELATTIPTIHTLRQGDARDLSWIGNGEIPLVVTSCPYGDLIDYGSDPGQLAMLPSYEAFVEAMQDVLRECWRVLMPGGKVLLNVGDVLRSRKQFGSHHILPLHSHLEVAAYSMGFLKLNGILWNKIGNVSFEQGGGGQLGKPGQPNPVIPLEYEHVLQWRKPGPYRSPTAAQREASAISKSEQQSWVRQIWADVPGARATKQHPCPYPITIPHRLIRLNSFVGDTILDPFAGSCTTARAAMQAQRNSLSVDVNGAYIAAGIEQSQRFARELVAA